MGLEFQLISIRSKSNHRAVIIEDDSILVGKAHHVGHSITSSSKDFMHAMRRVGTSMHEIIKSGFKVREKTKLCQIFRVVIV